MAKNENKTKIGTTFGMRGWFPVMYDNDGPIQTGITCKDSEEARQEAIEWAKAEWGDDWKEHCDYKEEDIN